MGKSLVAVNAGPRVRWNTDTLINEAIKGAESQECRKTFELGEALALKC